MKTNDDYKSDREILLELLNCNLRIEKKLNKPVKATLETLGFINNDDFMTLLGIKRGTATQLRNSGAIRFSKIRGQIFYKLADVIDMLNAHFDRQ
jgi:hypothetical protein